MRHKKSTPEELDAHFEKLKAQRNARMKRYRAKFKTVSFVLNKKLYAECKKIAKAYGYKTVQQYFEDALIAYNEKLYPGLQEWLDPNGTTDVPPEQRSKDSEKK